MSSIRDKLLFTLIGALVIAGVMTATATYFSAQEEFNKFLDVYLQETAESLKNTVRTNSLNNDETTSPIILGAPKAYQVILQIYDSSTNKLWLSEDKQRLPLPDMEGFALKQIHDKQWQTYSVTSGTLIITVAQEITVRSELAAAAAFRTLQPLCLLLPFIAIAIWLVVGDGLAPLDRTERSIARRSPTSLKPISTQGLPFELLGLVSAINQLMTRLEESLSAQQRFASDAAHELRTPLTAIKLQVQLAQRAKTEDARNKCFDKLNQGVNRATRLVEQLLILARLDPESTKHPYEAINLDQLVKSVSEDMTPIAEQKNIQITVSTEPTSTAGMGDAIRLMVTNLTDNAIRYTQEGGHIELKTFTESNKAVISISDNGPGIPLEDRIRVFDRFYRSLGTKTAGTGLGLAIVKRIIDLHHGTINITDGLNGQGTCFTITLPK